MSNKNRRLCRFVLHNTNVQMDIITASIGRATIYLIWEGYQAWHNTMAMYVLQARSRIKVAFALTIILHNGYIDVMLCAFIINSAILHNDILWSNELIKVVGNAISGIRQK